jgi:26S proteasome regulatory subunit N6
MAAAESARIQEAQKLAKSDPRKAEAIYKDIISKAPSTTSDAATREYETALISLGELYRDEKCALLQYRFSCAPLTITTERRKSW